MSVLLVAVSAVKIEQESANKNSFITPPPVGGRGIDFEQFLSSFRPIYLFLRQQHYENTAGPTCMKFSGKVWSDHGTT